MKETVTVIDLLEEIEDIVGNAAGLPLTGKIMVDSKEMLDIVSDIRRSLPDDVQQARWIREERDRILEEAKAEYKRIVVEAKKEADRMVEQHVITQRAKEVATEIYNKADRYSVDMRLKTYDYLDKTLFDFRENMEEMQTKYVQTMYEEMNRQLETITGKVNRDMGEIRKMADEVAGETQPVHNVEVNFDSQAPEKEGK